MYRSTTRGIQITVEPAYMAEQSLPQSGRYFWSYTIEIKITDGNGKIQEVRGEGVVGEQPTIGPGSSFTYTSGCPLETPQGIMVGAYVMEGPGGEMFSVDIPAFSLDLPTAARVLH